MSTTIRPGAVRIDARYLTQSVPTASNAEYYAQIVQEKATLRAMILASTENLRDAYGGTHSARDLLNQTAATAHA